MGSSAWGLVGEGGVLQTSVKHPQEGNGDVQEEDAVDCCFSAAFTHLVNMGVESGDTDKVQGRESR